MGNRKRFEALVAVLLRDLDQFGTISPYAASSKLANDFRLSGHNEHETALGVCLTQVIALFKSGRGIEATSLLGQAKETSEIWVAARSLRSGISAEFFRQVQLQTGWT